MLPPSPFAPPRTPIVLAMFKWLPSFLGFAAVPFTWAPFTWAPFTWALLAGVLAPSPIQAADPQQPREAPGTFTFQLDNDKIADTDRHYTNGVRIGYTHDTPTGQWLATGRDMADLAWFDSTEGLRVGWTVGQDMYTPEDVDAFVPDPTDRPYAGWAYLGLNAQSETLHRLDAVDVNFGIIGPASNAAQTQNAFHRLINVSVSRGWRKQIHNEAGLLITRTAKYRAVAHDMPWGLSDGLGGRLQGDWIAHGTAQLGNVRTGAALGATVRLGANLRDDFGPTYGGFALAHKRPDRPTWSLFLGGEARAVAWDAFLDGNAFRDSPDVNKKPYVLEGRMGIATHWPLSDAWARYTGMRGVRASLTLVNRSREFEGQDKADRYGSLSVMVNF